MIDSDKILDNEFIKSFLQQEVIKPLNFIDQKFNEYETLNKDRIKELEKEINFLKESKIKSDHDIDILKNDKFHLSKELVKIKEDLSLTINNRSFYSHINSIDNKLSELKEMVADSIIGAEKCKQETALFLYRMTEDINTNEAYLKELNDRFKDHEESFHDMSIEISVMKDSDAQYRKEFEDHADLVFSEIESKLNESEIQNSNIDKFAQKSCKTVRQDAINLSNEIESKFKKFEEANLSEVDINKKRLKNCIERLDILKEEIIICKKGGKADKEIEDFMKQVAYNAKQIEKIQNLLEEM